MFPGLPHRPVFDCLRYALRNASDQNTLVRVVNLEDCGHAVGNKVYSGI